jgi:hypothetical protein
LDLGCRTCGPDGGNPIANLATKAKARTFITNDDSIRVTSVSGDDETEPTFEVGRGKFGASLAALATRMMEA